MKYLGLMSGTSADGIDAALVSLPAGGGFSLDATLHQPYPDALRRRIDALRDQTAVPATGFALIRQLGELDTEVGEVFAATAMELLAQAGLKPDAVNAIGSHGQTIAHSPEGSHPFSLQIGNAAVIAERTGITTVTDFRARDIAAGGHGAPLVPAFHRVMFGSDKTARAIVNIGGIANVTFLPPGNALVLGFDTGPGNTLLDTWIRHQLGKSHDEDGSWAASGRVVHELYEHLLSDAYFKTASPKSTGQERFNLQWIQAALARLRHVPAPQDVQATLASVTAESIVQALQTLSPSPAEVYLCGGGVHNTHLVSVLRDRLAGVRVETTAALGLDPDWVEAAAFGWLAHQTLSGAAGNLPSVTGAKRPVILGAIYRA